MKTFYLLACLLFGSTSSANLDKDSFVQEPEWDYEEKGPKIWPKIYPTCGGKRQSPIDLNPRTSFSCINLPDFAFNGYNSPIFGASIINTGESVRVDVPANSASFTGGGLFSSYNLIQFHFHWGAVNSRGSEHTINGERCSMELHFVHNSTLGKTAVLAVLIEASSRNNPAFDPIVNALSSVTTPGEPVSLPVPVTLQTLLPLTSKYFRYRGSLTTPPCTEGVIWTVFPQHLKIGNSQIARFRSVRSREGGPLVDNFRPTQRRNGRTVQMSRALGKTPIYCP